MDKCEVASICGRNSGEVKNCIVRGSYTISAIAGTEGGLRANHFVAEGTEAHHCIFTSVVYEKHNPDNLVTPASQDPNAFSGAGETNCRNINWAWENWGGDYMSSIPGKSGTPFYKYLQTTKGYGKTSYVYNEETVYYCVYLRIFVNFKITM